MWNEPKQPKGPLRCFHVLRQLNDPRTNFMQGQYKVCFHENKTNNINVLVYFVEMHFNDFAPQPQAKKMRRKSEKKKKRNNTIQEFHLHNHLCRAR